MASSSLLGCFVICLCYVASIRAQYFGRSLGALSQFHHGVRGEVFAVDSRTIFIKGFNYDGEGPAAYFYAGSSKAPGNNGFRLRDERGSTGVLRRYRDKDITLSLPDGKTLQSVRWFSVWCDDFAVNFGDVRIPKGFDFPKPQKISGLSGVHGVTSDNIVIVDAQTLLVPNFSYDGEAPDAKFWVGRGPKPSPNGIRIPDENGKDGPLRRYDRKTIVLTLPNELTIFDIGHFGVWCEAFTVDFGHVQIPSQMNVPPSLKMLGVSPQSKLNCEVLFDDLAFEARWAVAGESIVVQLVAKLDPGDYMSFGLSADEQHSVMIGGDVVVAWVDQTTGKGYAQDYHLDAKSQCAGSHGSCPDERLGEKTNSIRLLNAAMVNGYSIVTYQRPLRPSDDLDRAVITNGSQAIIWAVGPLNQRNEVSFHSHYLKGDRLFEFGRQPVWNCPMPEADERMLATMRAEEKEQQAEREEATQTRTRGRKPSIATDRQDAQTVPMLTENKRRRGPTRQQAIEQRTHVVEIERSTPAINTPAPTAAVQQRRPVPTPAPAQVPKSGAWDIPPIQCDEPDDGVFYAQMGPTGGKQGYPAITGHVGWGISWYINGLLIPVVNVVRGKTYTFVVEGGIDADIPAKYHPFYITDDPVGGYEHKSEEEKSKINIYAGVKYSKNGDVIPTGVGRLCNWTPNRDGPPADDYTSFGAYQRSLSLICDNGEPGVITWTPDARTPDTVYYQCFTHRYLGWKINVLDSCDELPAESAKVEVFSKPEEDLLESVPSQHVETRVQPAFNFVNEGGKSPVAYKAVPAQPVKEVVEVIEHDMHKQPVNYFIQKPLTDKNIELKKTIQDGIKAAEDLEQTIKFGENTGPVLFGSSATKAEPIIEYHPVDINTELKNFQKQNIQHNVFFRHPQHKPNPPPKFGTSQRRPVNHQSPRRPVYTQVLSKRPQMRPQFIMGQHSIIVNQYKKPGFKQPFRQPVKPFYAPNFNQYRNAFPPLNNGRPLKNNFPAVVDTTNFHELLQGKPGQIIIGKPVQTSLQPGSSEQKLLHGYPTLHYPVIPPRPQITLDGSKILNQRLDSKAYDKQGLINTHLTLNKPINTSPKPVYHHAQHNNDYEDTSPKIVLPTIRPAINTGFKPDSVIIEGGFKPIVREQDTVLDSEDLPQITVDRRSDTSNEKDELDFEEENVGEIFVGKRTEPFEPMFIPSPPDRQSKNKNKVKTKIDMRTDSILTGDKIVEMGEDKMAMAGERVESYYLPPVQYNHAKLVGSQGDIELPVGTVITYDGKAVSEDTLSGTVQTNSSRKVDNRYIPPASISKTEQFIRGTPQFAPFRGDIPPPIPDNLNTDQIPQLHLKGTTNLKQLTSQEGSTNDKPAAISTHLKLIRQVEAEDDLSGPEYTGEATEIDEVYETAPREAENRSKRSAHHTPEHTQMQSKETNFSSTSNHEHEHDHHDHDHNHEHHHHTPNSCNMLSIPTLSIIILITTLIRIF